MLSIQRRLRLLVVAALSAMALAVAGPTTSASAEVSVSGISEITLDGWYELRHNGSTAWNTYGGCDEVLLDGDVEPQGEIVIDTVETVSSENVQWYYWQACNSTWHGPWLDDYSDLGWKGQVVGPGDAGYLGNHDFEGLIYPAFAGVFPGSKFPSPMRFGIDGELSGQVWSYDNSVIYEDASSKFELHGEFTSRWTPEIQLAE